MSTQENNAQVVWAPVGAEHDGDWRFGLVERLCGGGLLQLCRPARAGETEVALESTLSLIHHSV